MQGRGREGGEGQSVPQAQAVPTGCKEPHKTWPSLLLEGSLWGNNTPPHRGPHPGPQDWHMWNVSLHMAKGTLQV